MSLDKVQEQRLVDLMTELYSVVQAVDDDGSEPKRKDGLSWRRTVLEGCALVVYLDENKLIEIAGVLIQDASVEKKFSINVVGKKVFDFVCECKIVRKGCDREDIKAFVRKLASEPPVEFMVYMPLWGAAVRGPDSFKKGQYTFIPSSKFDAIGVPGLPVEMREEMKNKIWGGRPHVAVPVMACDGEKAREIAQQEFKWLENAVRFFINTDVHDFSITFYAPSYAENSMAVSSKSASLSSHLKGPYVCMNVEELFANNANIDLLVQEVGQARHNLSELRERIRRAVHLGGLSTRESDLSVAYFLCVSGLEALFQCETDKYVNQSIANQIGEAFAFLIVDEDERRIAFEKMRSVYRLRSSVAHGGNSIVSKKRRL